MSVTRRFDTKQGHWYKLDGEKVDGVTSIIGAGVPKPALTMWAAREVAVFAAENLELLAQLDRESRIDLLKGSPYRDRDRAARRGTEVHRLAQKLQAGETVEVPEELEGHVDSYIRFVDDWQPTDQLIERVVLSRQYRYMGTFDAVGTLDGRRLLYDIKTTRSGVYGEVALQLAAYRYAEAYLDDQGLEEPMPEVDGCAVLWIRADGYDLIPVDADRHIFRQFLYAQQIAQFAKHAPNLIGDSLTVRVAS